jgi:hypothetical protein
MAFGIGVCAKIKFGNVRAATAARDAARAIRVSIISTLLATLRSIESRLASGTSISMTYRRSESALTDRNHVSVATNCIFIVQRIAVLLCTHDPRHAPEIVDRALLLRDGNVTHAPACRHSGRRAASPLIL